MQLTLTWTTAHCTVVGHTAPIPAFTYQLPNGLRATTTICRACQWQMGIVAFSGRVTTGAGSAATPPSWDRALHDVADGQPAVWVSRADWTAHQRKVAVERRRRFRTRCARLGHVRGGAGAGTTVAA